MSTRREVARAIYTAAAQYYPGRPLVSWDELPASSLEYWGGLADAAMAAQARAAAHETPAGGNSSGAVPSVPPVERSREAAPPAGPGS